MPEYAPLPMRPTAAFARVMEAMNAGAYRQVLQQIDARPGARVLEIGFGSGAFLALLLRRDPAAWAAGIDPTPAMLAVATRKLHRYAPRVDLRCGDATSLPWPEDAFDAVVSIHAFQFWAEPMICLREIARVLRPRGLLCLHLRDHTRHAPDWLPNPLSRSGNEKGAARRALEDVGFSLRGSPPHSLLAQR